MFGAVNRQLFLATNRRPLSLGQHGPGRQSHVQSEIVEAAQIIVGRDGAGMKHAQKMFRPGFQSRKRTQTNEAFS